MQVEPKVFSFPYGELDMRMKEIVKQSGFIAAAAQNSGVLSESSDIFQCPRFPMSEAFSSKTMFIEKASMHSLRVLQSTSEDFTLGKQNPPVLTLTFDAADLDLKRLQCFVQGGECEVKTSQTKDDATLTIRSRTPLTRRRTLYTLTIPDKKGRWHWYSHLWINTAVRQKGY